MAERPPPELLALALNSLPGNSGWQVYCERFNEIVAHEIDKKIFDPETPDEECRVLRRARKLLVDNYAPEKVRTAMVAVMEQLIRNQRR